MGFSPRIEVQANAPRAGASGNADDLWVAVGPDDGSKATDIEVIIRDEICRLEQVFSIDDDSSMLNRWIEDPSVATTTEFDRLLSAAIAWQRLSRGAYNVRMRPLRDLWKRAADEGCQPSAGELHELATELAEAPYHFDGQVLRQVRDCTGLDLRAIVTGFSIDVAMETAMRRCHVDALTVGAHDKIVHRGLVAAEVCVAASADGSGASSTVTLHNAAVAALHVDQRTPDRRSDPVLDPRTGRPVRANISVAVVAPDAITADAVAAVVSVMPARSALHFVAELNSPGRARHPSEFSVGVALGPLRCRVVDARHDIHDHDFR